jgi:hypothetical protein
MTKLFLPLIIFMLILTGCEGPAGSLGGLFKIQPTTTPTPVSYPLTSQPVSAAAPNDVNSYRASLIIEFDGLKQQERLTGSIESLTEIDRRAAMHHYYAKNNGITELFQTGDYVFLKKPGEPTWQMWPVSEKTNTDDPLPGLPGWEQLLILPKTVQSPPQPQTLNNLNVQYYTFTEQDLMDLPDLVVQKAQGEVWLSVPGNIVMQYTISATLKYVSPPPQAHLFDQGHLHVGYSVADVNQPLAITPPKADVIFTKTPFEALPRLPDATITTIFPTLIEYTSAQSPISATIFYRNELLDQDWEEANADIFNEKAQMSFVKADERLSVIILPREDTSQTKIGLSLSASP